jgi:hypothetical protein
VLQRTFNLVVTARDPTSGDATEADVEFSMLDQATFAGIDAYVRRHGLNDASLAETRRAKVYGVNLPKDKAAKGGAEEGEGEGGVALNGRAEEEGIEDETELQRAEKLLQDEEDEEEEDYVDEGSEEEEESSEDEGYEGGSGEGEVFEEEAEFDDEAGSYEDDG